MTSGPPTLEELSRWAYNEDDDQPWIFDTDIDVAGEIAEDDEAEEDARRCPGSCPHHGRCGHWPY